MYDLILYQSTQSRLQRPIKVI